MQGFPVPRTVIHNTHSTMLKRLIPISALLFLAFFAQAQVPQSINYEGKLKESALKEMPCNNAGTVNISLGSGVQTNDPVFLCYGDSIFIDHQGDQVLSGDPNAATTPGIGYAFYNNVPTVDGPNLNAILFDPSVLDKPAAPGGLWVATGANPNGDMYFVNNGNLQLLFNAGKPVEIWFAPITLDNWATKAFEGTPAGPCVNVNIADAFPVVYLNKIFAKNLSNTDLGAGTFNGSFTVEGGWPEFLGSQTYNITIALKTNPLIKGIITSGPAKNGSTVAFTVPQPGTYVITVEDGKSCGYVFEMKFPAIAYNLESAVGYVGDTVCLTLTVDNFNKVIGHTLFINFDPSVLQFIDITYCDPSLFGMPTSNVSPSNIVNHLVFATDIDNGVSIPDGSCLFNICFKLIGQPFDCSMIKIDSLNPNDHSNVVVTDGNFNYFEAPLNLVEGEICILPANLGLDVISSVVQPTCPGGTDGSFEIKAIGGKFPYAFNWAKVGSPGIMGSGTIPNLGGIASIQNLSAGIYSVTVTDSSVPKEQVIITIIVQDPNPIDVTFNTKAPTCFDSKDGSIDITLTNGGTAPYIYTWDPPTTDTFNQTLLGNGTYKLTVTDKNNCSATFTQVFNTTQVVASLVKLANIGCGSMGGGSIEVTATGGTGPYDYIWDDPAMTAAPLVTNLPVGTYTVTVSDAEGCSTTLDTTIQVLAGITVTGFDSLSILCGDKNTGQLTVKLNIPAGSSVNSYTWSGPTPGGNTATINGLSPGTYYVTVEDNAGCSVIDSAKLWAPAPLSISGEVINMPSCPGNKNGSVGVSIAGGTPPYSYMWSTNPGVPTSLSVIPAVMAGFYSFTITDANNCGPLVHIIELKDPPKIVNAFSNVQPTSCLVGNCDGTATSTATYSDGTTGNFNFTWESSEFINGVMSSTASMLCEGWQSVSISDANCALIDSVLITSPGKIVVDLDTLINISCNGLNDGIIKVKVSGGTPGFTYNWSTPGTPNGNTLMDAAVGTYFVTVTDSKGCSEVSVPFQMNEPSVMMAMLDPSGTQGVTCADDMDGRISVFYTGGNAGNATYTWNPNVSTTNLATKLGYGTYTVTITDPRGCSDTVSYTISQPASIVANIPPITQPECFGYQTYASVTSASGGSGAPYTFSVDNGLNISIAEKIPIFAGDHIITVYDKNGCSITQIVSVSEPAPVVVTLGPDVEIQLGDSLQLLPYVSIPVVDSFKWTPTSYIPDPQILNPFVKPTEVTTFTLKVWDDNGCFGSDNIVIDVDNRRNVFVPNVFSPNSDGINDIFRIGTGIGVDRINYMRIYDRWGELLYEATNITAGEAAGPGWDGKFNGRYMNSGVYVYLIEVRFLDNVSLLYRGDVTLLR